MMIRRYNLSSVQTTDHSPHDRCSILRQLSGFQHYLLSYIYTVGRATAFQADRWEDLATGKVSGRRFALPRMVRLH